MVTRSKKCSIARTKRASASCSNAPASKPQCPSRRLTTAQMASDREHLLAKVKEPDQRTACRLFAHVLRCSLDLPEPGEMHLVRIVESHQVVDGQTALAVLDALAVALVD